uniref:Uncharacterized protein n=1 Tax=Anguilla anguilla TaxID=7936 RepID=A0A0E9TK58_ANGAN
MPEPTVHHTTPLVWGLIPDCGVHWSIRVLEQSLYRMRHPATPMALLLSRITH